MIAVSHVPMLYGDALDYILSSFISSRSVQSPDMFPIDLAVERVLVTSIRIPAGQVVSVRVVVCVIVTVSFGVTRHGGFELCCIPRRCRQLKSTTMACTRLSIGRLGSKMPDDLQEISSLLTIRHITIT
jgi:hypothetical protein